MSIYKKEQVFIGNGTVPAVAGDITSSAAQNMVITPNGSTVDAASYGTDNPKTLKMANKYTSGRVKISNPLNVNNLTGGAITGYQPATRSVSVIGWDRSLAVPAGSLVAVNDTTYSFRIVLKGDKSNYSERPESLYIEFKTPASGTTSDSVATQIANAINNSGFGEGSIEGVRNLKAIAVGTGATAAVEIHGLNINQFANTTYTEEFVMFDVYLDSDTGFGATTSTKVSEASKGLGTYASVALAESYSYKALNNVKWPVPERELLASNTPAILTPAENVAVVQGSDVATFSATVAAYGLRPGEKITINSVDAEIKFIVSDTEVVLVDVWAPASAPAATFAVKTYYSAFTVTCTDVTTQDGAGVAQLSSKRVTSFVPAFTTGVLAGDLFDVAGAGQTPSTEYTYQSDLLTAFVLDSPVSLQVNA